MKKPPASILLALISSAFSEDLPEITEFLASNSEDLLLPDSSSPDWIEIHNPGASAISLEGWHLTDDSASLNKWTFPAETAIAAGDFLMIYASGLNTANPSGIHTNFKLNDRGEYLALVRPDGTVQQEFSPDYPRQYTDVSYGLSTDGTTFAYFQDPTPGDDNGTSVLGFVKDTTFSHKRGFYDETFQLEVTTATPGATIRYTIDGSTPDDTSPTVSAPSPDVPPVLALEITTTTIVRALAEKPGFESTNIDTQTYLFLDQVIDHPNMSTTITDHPVWGEQIRDALLEVPTISLVTQQEVPTTPIMSPPEIPVSIEMFFPDGREGFQMDAGIERFGGQYTLYPKHALRVSFKEIYGPKKLKFDLFSETPYGSENSVESFDQILLRNGSHDSIFAPQYSHSRGVYVRNRYFFDRQLEAGHLSMQGRFVHVYLNGEYYGHYHLMERPNADFMASHLGGEEEDYDIMKGRSGIFVSQGESTAWDYLQANKSNYEVVKDYLDLDSYIDYMLLNFYGGNDHDWYPQHNWVAGRKREAGGKFKFFMWDNDFLIRRGGNSSTSSPANTTDNGGPGNMLSAFLGHQEFKIRLADRAQKHFFNGGMLTPERVQHDIDKLAQSISRTLIPESARWAVTAKDLEPGMTFYTPDVFQNYVGWITNVNAPARSNTVINQMKSAGMFPDVDAPEFNQHGGRVPSGFGLVLSNTSGEIYYTTDGSDPRLPGGDVSPSAFEFPGSSNIVEIFPAGSDWKFNDTGDLGNTWQAPDYDDASWGTATAPMGFGSIDSTTLATQVNLSRNQTFYTRKTFNITDANAISSATVHIHADDGTVVYLNGIEVVRDNMPEGSVNFSTGTISNGDEGVFESFTFSPDAFEEGTNIIAVEIHNRTARNNDMVFDLALEISRPYTIDQTTTIRARSLDGSTWSALNEATFLTGAPASADNLVISKLHYNPSDLQGALSEYLELMNVSGDVIDLAGLTFTQGITFSFAEDAVLAPGERGVIVADPVAFAATFGNSATILGTYTSRLANDGELLTLRDAGGNIIQSFAYNDRSPWPTSPDGGGYTLVLIAPTSLPDHHLPQNWRSSLTPDLAPGSDDGLPFEGDPATDLFTYALGNPDGIRLGTIDGKQVLELPRIEGADEVVVVVETSNDLKTWTSNEAVLLDQLPGAGGGLLQTWSLPEGNDQVFARVMVRLIE